jgi:hypothetical protein
VGGERGTHAGCRATHCLSNTGLSPSLVRKTAAKAYEEGSSCV